jgi:hypothetical protein
VKLYLDESGHSGKQLFDEYQPTFVYAGVLLDPATESEVEKRANAHPVRPGDGERKGSRLLTSAPGRRLVREYLEPCIHSGTALSVVAFNKPFQAAAVVVEDCTDYAFNPAFDERWTWDTRLKEPLARLIYQNAPPKQLMDVWRARRGTQEDFVRCYESLMFALRLSTNHELSERASDMARTDFARIWEVDQGSTPMMGSYSPNLNAFIPLVQGANRQAKKRGIEAVDVVHDEQVEYQPQLTKAFELFQKAAPIEWTAPNGNVFNLPLDRLRSLSFRPSSTTIGLQIADIVAGFVRIAIQTSPPDPKVLGSVARWIIEAGDGIFPSMFGPPEWQMSAFRGLHEAAR